MTTDTTIPKIFPVQPSLSLDSQTAPRSACARCRALHRACEGSNPCIRCTRAGVECSSRAPNKRGRKKRCSPTHDLATPSDPEPAEPPSCSNQLRKLVLVPHSSSSSESPVDLASTSLPSREVRPMFNPLFLPPLHLIVVPAAAFYITSVTVELCHCLGISLNELVGHSLLELISPSSQAALRAYRTQPSFILELSSTPTYFIPPVRFICHLSELYSQSETCVPFQSALITLTQTEFQKA